MIYLLIVKDVTKEYGDKIGNFQINLEVEHGEVYGLLGPNGAGKTTLIRQIMGFVKPDSGSITIDEMNSWTQRAQIMENLGYLPGELVLYDSMKGINYLKMVAKFKGVKDFSFVERLIEYFELDPSSKIKKMSKGMKQKIAIICAVMSKPKYLILDEPTNGLDPLMQNNFNSLVGELKKNGTTIIICSHIFEEVAQLCDRVGFLKEGKLIKEEKVKKKSFAALQKEFLKFYEKKGGVLNE